MTLEDRDGSSTGEGFGDGLDHAGVGMSLAALDGRFLRVNRSLCRMLGRSEDELLRTTFSEVTHPDDVRANHHALARLHRAPDEPVSFVKRYLRADGSVLHGLVTVSLLTVDGERCYLTQIEPTEARDEVRSLRRAEQAAATELLAGQAAVLEGVVRGRDLDATLRSVGELAERSLPGAFCALHVAEPGGDFLELVAGAHLPPPMRQRALRLPVGLEGGAAGTAAASGQLVVADVPTDPRTAPFRALAAQLGVRSAWAQPLVGRDQRVLGVLSCYVTRPGGPDPVEEVRLEMVAGLATLALERDDLDRQMRTQALHDPLTGLPNRTLLLQRVEHALAQNSRTGFRTALLFCDVDRLKPVNDGLGHHVGDQLLVAVGRRLTARVRAGDTVARLSGDEFVVLLDGVYGEEEARAVAERVLAGVLQPLALGEHELHPSLSVGLALSPPHASSVGALDLLRAADMAMYEAKAAGRGRVRSSAADVQARGHRRWQLEGLLRRALEEDELEVHYQPQIDLASGRCTGVEALVRWFSDSQGQVPPSEFVPLAEEAGLVRRIGTSVLRRACADLARLPPALGDVTVSVNLSAQQLVDPGLHELVVTTLAETGLDGSRLVLEITESVLMDDPLTLLGTLQGLRELGVGISVDDVGTGYSSLLHLKRLPVTQLKIDTAFVAGLGQDVRDEAIVRALTRLGLDLGLDVVAERVETADQRAALAALGCPRAQGFLLGRPVPVARLQAPPG